MENENGFNSDIIEKAVDEISTQSTLLGYGDRKVANRFIEAHTEKIELQNKEKRKKYVSEQIKTCFYPCVITFICGLLAAYWLRAFLLRDSSIAVLSFWFFLGIIFTLLSQKVYRRLKK